MSKTLLLRDMKAHARLVIGFILILIMYFLVILNMFDPENPDIMNSLVSFKLSPALLKAFGFDMVTSEMNGFLAAYFYGMLMLAFPMALLVILGNKLVAHLVERGSMASVLAAPLSRRQAAVTQALFHISCAILLVTAITVTGLIAAGIVYPGQMDRAVFIRMNLGALAAHLLISSVSFFFSCLFNDTRWSLTLGAGLPLVFLLCHMLSKTGSRAAFLRYVTPYTLYEPMDYVKGLPVLPQALALAIAALLLYLAGIAVFERKDLPI